MRQHDQPARQYLYALILFLSVNGFMAAIFMWPFMLKQQGLSLELSALRAQVARESVVLAEHSQWQQRYANMISQNPETSTCTWQTSQTTDTMELRFEQAKVCLDDWVRTHDDPITEMTFYKKDQTRVLEIVHD